MEHDISNFAAASPLLAYLLFFVLASNGVALLPLVACFVVGVVGVASFVLHDRKCGCCEKETYSE